MTRYFLAGVFAILPLVITVAVVIWVADFVGNLIGPGTIIGDRLQNLGMRYVSNTTMAYVVGWIVVLGIVFLLGVLIEMGAKRLFQKLIDAIIERIPVVSGIYDTSKRLVEMLNKSDQTELQGMSAVFCQFGKEQGVGILALLVSPERYRINGREYQIVIVPTAPVPVGGGLLFVPADSITHSDISVDGLMSIYVSMGVTTSEFLPPQESA
jgi:uncharacterized membrane protein